MLQGTETAQKDRALEILSEIVSEAGGTATAKEALEILARYERPRREEPRDLVFEDYSRRWNGIQGLTDPNIIRLLRELRERPGVAARLRSNVVRDVSKWIKPVLSKISEGFSRQEVDTLNGFVTEVSQIDAYHVEEIAPLRRSLFLLRLQELRRLIDDALDRWAIDEAWRRTEELAPRPEGFEADVLQIQERIYKVNQFRQSVEDSLAQMSQKAPETWIDLRMLVNSLGNSTGHLARNQLPPEWRQRVKEAIDQGALAARMFLEKQASLRVEPRGLQEFWTRYSELELTGIGNLLLPNEDWFRESLNSILKDARAEVAGADSPEELKIISRKLTEGSDSLPPPVADRMRELAGEIDGVRANWLAMISGGEFDATAPEAGALPAPERFVKSAPDYRAQFDRINQALSAIDIDAAPTETAYSDGVRIAEEVLSRYERHASALKLKQVAERGILHWSLDKALQRWRIEEFVRLTREERAEGIYHDLSISHATLRALAELANREDLQGWQDAADWWKSWREKKRRLPQPESDWPDSLRLAVRRQEERRRDQWYGALETLIGSDLTPDTAQQAAESLRTELHSPSLQGYYEMLTRKAAAGRAYRYIEEGNFEEARKEMTALDEYHEETLRLRTKLNVKEAETHSIGKITDALFQDWQNVARYLPNARKILLETVRRAWETDEAGALIKLRMVLDHAISAGGSDFGHTDQLREWAEWLKVEQAILANQSLQSVNQMAGYLRHAELNDRFAYRQRLTRLARHWEANGNVVMLAWAYQAFNRVDPSILPSPRDPAEDLISDGTRIAERVFDAIRSLDPGPTAAADAENKDAMRQLREEVKKMTVELRDHQGKWKELNDYLDLLHYEENRSKPAPEFMRVQQLCESLLHTLDNLDFLPNADWRRDETLERFDATRRVVMKRFDGFALQRNILTQLEHWEPLTRLRFLESRIVEAAALCDSESKIEIYEERHFANLRRWIGELIDVLAQTGADSWKMWQIASADYCELVYNKAGILAPKIQPPDLRELARLVDRLIEEELEFKGRIDKLAMRMPNVPAHGRFDPQRHLDYLEQFPKHPPRSRKVYRRFDRFATGEPMLTILKQSSAYLHNWVRKYLEDLEKG